MSDVTFYIHSRRRNPYRCKYACFAPMGRDAGDGNIALYTDNGTLKLRPFGIQFHPITGVEDGGRYVCNMAPKLTDEEWTWFLRALTYQFGLAKAIGLDQTVASIKRKGVYVPLSRRTYAEMLYILTAYRYGGEDPALVRTWKQLTEHGVDVYTAYWWAHYVQPAGDETGRDGFAFSGMYGRNFGHTVFNRAIWVSGPQFSNALTLPWTREVAPLMERYRHHKEGSVHTLSTKSKVAAKVGEAHIGDPATYLSRQRPKKATVTLPELAELVKAGNDHFNIHV